MDIFNFKKKKRLKDIKLLETIVKAESEVTNSFSYSAFNSLMGLTTMGDIDARKDYVLDPWARRAVDLISNMGSTVEMKVENKQGKVKTSGKVYDFIQNPCLNLSYYDFITQSLGWLAVAGNILWKIDTSLSNYKKQVLIVPSDEVIINENCFSLEHPIINYTYKNNIISLNQSAYSYLWTTKNKHLGQGFIDSCSLDIGTSIEATQMVYNLLKHGGIPPYYVKILTKLNSEAFERIKTNLMNLRGAINSIKTPLFEGDVDIKTVQQSSKELMMPTLRKHTHEAIATAAGISIAMLTSGITTYENQKEAKIQAYEGVIIPLLNKLIGMVNTQVFPEEEDTVSIDYSSIPALRVELGQVGAISELQLVMDDNEIRSCLPWNLPPRKKVKKETEKTSITLSSLFKKDDIDNDELFNTQKTRIFNNESKKLSKDIDKLQKRFKGNRAEFEKHIKNSQAGFKSLLYKLHDLKVDHNLIDSDKEINFKDIDNNINFLSDFILEQQRSLPEIEDKVLELMKTLVEEKDE